MHLTERPEGQQSQDQTGRLIILQENPGSSSLCSPAQEGRSQAPRVVRGHCTVLICSSVLLYWNTGQSHSQWNLGPVISTAFALQDLLVWSFPVGRHKFKFTSWRWAWADRQPSLKPIAGLPSSAGARLNPFVLPWNLQWALQTNKHCVSTKPLNCCLLL